MVKKKINKAKKKKVKKAMKRAIKKAKKVPKGKTAKIAKVKIDGKPMSQKEVIAAASEIGKAEVLDNAYEAALNSLFKRTLMNNSKGVDVLTSSRLPIVIADRYALVARDKGALVLLPESNQEFMDDILICQKICESLSIPALIDKGADISENVSVPSQQSMETFLVKYPGKKDDFISITDEKNHQIVVGIAQAMGSARKEIEKISEKWMKKFHRKFSSIETAGLEDAQAVLVVYGQNSRSVKKAIMDLSAIEKPVKVGIIRIHVARPFPKDELAAALELVPSEAKIAVIDNVESLGMAGIMFTEVSSVTSRKLASFVAQKLLSTQNAVDIISQLLSQEQPDTLWIE